MTCKMRKLDHLFIPAVTFGLVVTLTLGSAAAGGFDDFFNKVNEITRKFNEYAPKTKKYVEQFDDVTTKAGKKTRFMDDKIDNNYEQLWNREIERKRRTFKQTRRDFLDTEWYRFFTRKKRQKAMDEAEQDYVNTKAKWEWEKYLFKRKVADETGGWTFFRKGDRKRQAEEQLQGYVNTILGQEENKIKKAQDRYDDTPGILFWVKWDREKEIKRMKKEYDRKAQELADLYLKLPGDSSLYNGLKTRVDRSQRAKELTGGLGALNGMAIGGATPGMSIMTDTTGRVGSKLGEKTGSSFEQTFENVIVKIAETFGGGENEGRKRPSRGSRIDRDSSPDM